MHLLALAPLFAAALAASSEKPTTAPLPALDKRWLQPYFQRDPTRAAAERYRAGDWQGAADGFARALRRLRRDSPEREPARAMRALALMNQERFGEAATLFEELWKSHPVLADQHAYLAARCRLRAGDATAALTWSERVPAGSTVEAEVRLVALDALEKLARWPALASAAEAFLERFPSGPRRAEARFRQATAWEKLAHPPGDVIPLYRQIWSLAPTESWAARADERLLDLVGRGATGAARDAGASASATAAQWFDRGMGLADKQQHVEAELAFTAALAPGTAAPGLRCQAEYQRAQAVFKQRQRPRAAPFYEQAELACRAAGDTDLAVKSLYQGARCRASMGAREVAAGKYAAIEKEFPAHSYADDARLRAAELRRDAGDEAGARALLTDIPVLYPQGDQVGESLFRLAFAAFTARDFDATLRHLDDNLRLIPLETQWFAEGRALYWRARVAQEQGHKNEAVSGFERAIREYPLSVYTLLSFQRLRPLSPETYQRLITALRDGMSDAPFPVDFGRHALYASPAFLRAIEYARLGLGTEARRELGTLGWESAQSRDEARAESAAAAAGAGATEPPSIRERALWLTSVLLARGRVWSASHAIPRYTLDGYKRFYPVAAWGAAWRLSYPRAFPELVGQHARANQVPQFLQLAIMREESAFNPGIESFANAIGLTQMLVKTAQRFSDTTVTRETLFDPAGNLTLGSKFLGFLLRHFNRQVPLAIAGYNAGEAAVDIWLRERGNLPLDEFLETIPFDETRGYTKRVLASYFAYTWLYGTGDPVPAVSMALRGGARVQARR